MVPDDTGSEIPYLMGHSVNKIRNNIQSVGQVPSRHRRQNDVVWTLLRPHNGWVMTPLNKYFRFFDKLHHKHQLSYFHEFVRELNPNGFSAMFVRIVHTFLRFTRYRKYNVTDFGIVAKLAHDVTTF